MNKLEQKQVYLDLPGVNILRTTKSWKSILLCAVLSSVLAGCQDLDIPPKNIISGSDIYNEGGITAYMAGLYNHLPMEDFNMGDGDDRGGFFNWLSEKTTLGSTGEFMNSPCGNSCVYGDKGYWKDGYQIIRQANVLIQDLPSYIDQLEGVEGWIAEARFIRAYTYFALVKRYGGVPVLKEPQSISEDGSALYVARNSHVECVDFILEDLDYAMQNMTSKKTTGRGNKYVAAALKSSVALYAGSIARYGQLFAHTGERGTQLCGIPAAKANDYFLQAYNASLEVDAGGYALHVNADKRTAFYEVFDKAASSTESIFIREYDINNYVHSWDQIMSPTRMVSGYGGRFMIPLDWVELFDGIPLDPATGWMKTVDDEGNYIVYNDQKELFANAEPRLKANVMMSGDIYKGYEFDMRCGLIREDIDPSQKIRKWSVDDGKTTYNFDRSAALWKDAQGNNIIISTRESPVRGAAYETSDGRKLAINGYDGPSTAGGQFCHTGFSGVKWINRSLPTGSTALHRSTQPWIDIRYAEVLLNRAEAAIELAQNGGDNNLQEAMRCINLVRDRGGADLIASTAELADMTSPTNVRGTGKNSFVFAPTKGLQIVRVERYKELAIEYKLYWDLRRWFTAHNQIKEYRRRMLAPYLFAKDAVPDPETGIPHGKYIYDTRCVISYDGQVNFDQKYYFEKIPDAQRKVNPLLEQNPMY